MLITGLNMFFGILAVALLDGSVMAWGPHPRPRPRPHLRPHSHRASKCSSRRQVPVQVPVQEQTPAQKQRARQWL